MTLNELPTLIGGVSIALTSFCLALWQILSAPDRPNYPTSGPIKRLFMFWYTVLLAGVAVFWITGLESPDPLLMQPVQFVACLLQLGLFTTFLVDHCRHWLPSHTHARIRQLLAIARCRPAHGVVEARRSAGAAEDGRVGVKTTVPADVVGPALAALTLDGVHVIGPNEGPETVAMLSSGKKIG